MPTSPLEQIFQRTQSRFRIGKNRDINPVLENFKSKLEEGYTMSAGERVGDYTRITISGREFTGENALTLDLRLGGQSAVYDQPAILLRSRGSASGSAESVIGAKIVPDEEVEGGYTIRSPYESLADIVNATFAATKTARRVRKNQDARKPNEELYGLLMDSGKRYKGVREKYMIPRGIQQMYSVPVPGEQSYLSASANIYIRSQQGFERELEKIRASAYGGHLSETLFYSGVYDAERVSKDIYQMSRVADIREVVRLGGRRDFEGFTWRGFQKGQESVYEMLKYIKMNTTYARSRSPHIFPIQYQVGGGKHARRTPVPIEPTSVDELGIDPENFGAFLRAGKYQRFTRSGLTYPGEEGTERDVNAVFALVGQTPTHHGAALTSGQELGGVDAWGAYFSKIIDLPFTSSRGFEKEQGRLSFIDELIGQELPGDAGHPLSLGTATVIDREVTNAKTKSGFAERDTDLILPSAQYTQHVVGATLVIAPYMDERTGKFYATPESAPKGVHLIRTDEGKDNLATMLRRRYGRKGISVEVSGGGNPFLSITTIGEIAHANKGLAAEKSGDTPAPDDLSARYKNDKGQIESMRLGSVTAESKQIVETFVSSFGLQPWKNKMAILGMIDPGLQKWAEENYKPGQAISVAAVADEYTRLKGSNSKYHYMEVFKVAYDKFRGANKNENLYNLNRYGIGYLPDVAQIGAGRVTEEFVEAQKQIARQEKVKVSTDKAGVVTMGKGDRIQTFVPVAGSPGYYEHSFTAAPTDSMIMPIGRGASIEWPGRGGSLSSDAVFAIAERYPEFAKEVGLLPEQGPGAGKQSKERRAWLNVMRAYMYNESSMQGDFRIPGQGHKDEEKFLRITQGVAEQLLDDEIFSAGRGKLTEEQIMNKLAASREKGGLGLGNRTLVFGTSGRFLPGAKSIHDIDLFNQAEKPGDSESHYATQWINALHELLQIEKTGDLRASSVTSHTELMGGPDSRIGRILSSGKDVTRHLYGREVAGAVGGRYKVLNVLKPGEAYLPDRELARLLRDAGLKRGEINDFKEWMEEQGGVSGIFWRYPHLSEKLGSTGLKFITSSELKSRGVNLKDFRGDTPGLAYINPFNIEPFIGDEDLDPHGLLLGFKFHREKVGTGEINPKTGKEFYNWEPVFEDILKKDPNFIKGQAKNRTKQELLEVIGSEAYKKYSTMYAQAKEYYDPNETPLKTASQFGWAQAETIGKSAHINAVIGTRRGTSYNVISSVEAAASALNIPKNIFDKSISGLPLLYQETLEWNKRAATSSPMEIMANTTMFKSRFVRGPRGPVESNLELVTATQKPEGSDMPNFQQRWSALGSSSWAPFLRTMIVSTAGMEEVSNEALALMFANTSGDNFKENYNKLIARLKGADRSNRAQRLLGGEQNALYAGEIGIESIAGLANLSHGIARAFRKAGEADQGTLRRQLYEDKSIRWRGKMYTGAEFADLPEVAANRRIYNMMTAKESMPGESTFMSGLDLEETNAAAYNEAREQENSNQMRNMRGIQTWLGYTTATKIAGKGMGGITAEQLREAVAKGPAQMHVSNVASIASGDKYGINARMSITAKMLGNLLGIDALKGELFSQEHLQKAWSIRMGNLFERHIAQTQQLQDNPYLLIPRGRGEKSVTWKAESGVELLGLPDFLQLEDTEDGPRLNLMELKFNPKRGAPAKIQAALYSLGLRKMYQQDPKALREVVESWQSAIKSSYRGDLTLKEPKGMGDDWVDKVMDAIGSGRISTKVGHGGPNKWLRNRFKVLDVEDVNMADSDVEAAVEKARNEIVGNVPSTTGLISSLVQYGSMYQDRDIQMFSGVKLPHRTIQQLQRTIKNAGLENLKAVKYFQTGGRGTNPPEEEEPEVDPNKPPKPGEYASQNIPVPSQEINLHSPERATVNLPEGGTADIITGPPQGFVESMKEVVSVTKSLIEILAKNAGGRGGIGGPEKFDTEVATPILRALWAREGMYSEVLGPEGQTSRQSAVQRIIGRFESARRAEYEETVAAGGGTGMPYAPLTSTGQLQEYLMDPNLLKSGRIQAAFAASHKDIRLVSQMGEAITRGVHMFGGDNVRLPPELEMIPGMKETFAALNEEYQAGGLGEDIYNIAGMEPFARAAALKQASNANDINFNVLPQSAQQDYTNNLLKGIQGLEKSINTLNSTSKDSIKVNQEQARAIKSNTDEMESFRDLAAANAKMAEISQKYGGAGPGTWREAAGGGYEKPGAEPGTWVPVGGTADEIRADLEAYETAASKAANVTQQRHLAAGLAGQGKAGKYMESLGGRLRSIFGSFGFFYMQRVAGWGVEGLTRGYEEYEKAAQAQQATAQGLWGVDQVSQRQNMEVAYQRALYRSGGPGMGFMRPLQTALTGTGLGDVVNIGKGMAGAAMGSLFLAGEMGATGAGLIASPFIGAAVAGIAIPSLMLYGYASEREKSLSYAAATYANANLGLEGNWIGQLSNRLGGGFRMLGPTLADMFTGKIKGLEGTVKPGSPVAQAAAQGKELTDFLTNQAVGAPDDVEKWRRIAAALPSTEAWKGILPDAITEAVLFQGIGTPASQVVSQDVAMRHAKMLQGGINVSGIISAGLQAGGYLPTPGANLSAFQGLEDRLDLSQQQQIGFNVATSMSRTYLEISGIGAGAQTSEQFFKTASDQLSKYAYQPYLSVQQRESNLAQRAYELGETGMVIQPMDVIARNMWSAGWRESFTAFQGQRERQLDYKEYLRRQYGQGKLTTMAMDFRAQMGADFGTTGINVVEGTTGLQSQLTTMLGYGNQEMAQQMYQSIVTPMATGNFAPANIMNRVMSGDPIAMWMAMANRPDMQQKYGSVIPLDRLWSPTGMGTITSKPIYSSSITSTAATNIWGNWMGNSFTRNAVAGYTPMFASSDYKLGGIEAIQAQMSDTQYQAQMASFGAQMAQINLQREYLPKFRAIEDQQRALGHRQTLWGFGQQQRQIDLSRQQFGENYALNLQSFGLNVTQSMMQRGWAQQDWGVQAQQRALTWGWKQEDFAENVRFMSGRERRLATKQMGRETIMHDLEGEQIDKQKARQKQLWALEDERFGIQRQQYQLQKKQFEENLAMQQSSLDKQREFYNEGYELQEEAIKLQREYQDKQIDLQASAIGAQAAYATALQEAKTKLEEVQRDQAKVIDNFRFSVDYGNMISDFTYDLGLLANKLKQLGYTASNPTGWLPEPDTGDDDDDDEDDEDWASGTVGFTVPAGYNHDNFKVGLTSGERVTVTPSFRSTWNNATMVTPTVGTGAGVVHLTVNIGNELLGKYVIQAVEKDLTM